MAINKKAKFFHFCASFLVIIILCNQIHVCVEARHLRTHRRDQHCKHCSRDSKKISTPAETKGKSTSQQQLQNTNGVPSLSGPVVQGSKVERAEDFRPTVPGRSPGVGHSIQN